MSSRRVLAVAILAALPIASGGCAAINKAKNVANALGDINKDTAKLEAAIEKAKTLTFTAQYDQTDEDGKVSKVTIAQKPPKSSLTTSTSVFLDDGTNIISCSLPDATSGSNTKAECTTLGPSEPGGFYGGAFLMAGPGFGNPLAFLPALKLLAALGGVKTSSTSESFAGQKADCISFDKDGTDAVHIKSCTTADGILAMSQTTSSNGKVTKLVLTKYDTTVKDSAFVPPAKSQTIEDKINAATSTTSTTYGTTTTEASTTTSTTTSSPASTSTSETTTTTTSAP